MTVSTTVNSLVTVKYTKLRSPIQSRATIGAPASNSPWRPKHGQWTGVGMPAVQALVMGEGLWV
eukprot:CAMPEP_0194429698 /NCGR_PEP_ID=MMETSP0176-20130528/48868_1 /TAXON_ID=216777 /ORGANISM="Proboscia alata, Strain PI-D3" /LENGTH=63 /DNA_ID=CAMNT_0039243079 /DNA_START=10 /DNA_END=201 /DNA_ORIENTATION=+